MHDMERLVGRAALGTAGPRDLVALRQSLAAVPRVRLLLVGVACAARPQPVAELDDLADIRHRARVDARQTSRRPLARDGGAIRDGVDPELDDLRTISRSGKHQIAAMEEARARQHRASPR